MHPLGAGIKQLPDPSDFPGIPPQHELPQTTDRLGKMLTALGQGSKGSAASPPQVPSSSLKPSENFVEHKPSSSIPDNQNNIHALHPLGAGINLPDPSDSHGIPPQHELSQSTDQLGNLLTSLGWESKGSAALPPQVPSSILKPSENFVEHKPRTPISGISSSARPSNPNPAVTPLSHICAFMLL